MKRNRLLDSSFQFYSKWLFHKFDSICFGSSIDPIEVNSLFHVQLLTIKWNRPSSTKLHAIIRNPIIGFWALAAWINRQNSTYPRPDVWCGTGTRIFSAPMTDRPSCCQRRGHYGNPFSNCKLPYTLPTPAASTAAAIGSIYGAYQFRLIRGHSRKKLKRNIK